MSIERAGQQERSRGRKRLGRKEEQQKDSEGDRIREWAQQRRGVVSYCYHVVVLRCPVLLHVLPQLYVHCYVLCSCAVLVMF